MGNIYTKKIMEFGILKTKIEDKLIYSYVNNKMKKDLFVFEQLILNNKNLSKLYLMYDELSSKKGLNESLGNDFISENILGFKSIKQNVLKSDLDEINMWIGHLKSENRYRDVDNLFTSDVTRLEEKVKSKQNILTNLMEVQKVNESKTNISLPNLMEIANKTVNDYLNTLSESEKKEIKKIMTEDEDKLKIEFNFIKENSINRLNNLKLSESDSDVVKTIDETISKIDGETFTKISYVKLKKLNEEL
jgi:hypothetical protein